MAESKTKRVVKAVDVTPAGLHGSVTAEQAAELRPTRSKALTIIGDTGLKRSGGIILEEWHFQLRGRAGMKMYREMTDNDAVIGAMLFIIESLVRELEWRVEPATPEDPKLKGLAEEAAIYLEQVVEDMDDTWEDFMAEVLSMLSFGWSMFEILYKKRRGSHADPRFDSQFDDNRWGWRNFEIRAQETLESWIFNQHGQALAMKQLTDEGKFATIPMWKSLLFRTKSNKNNPEGRSILRNIFRTYNFKKRTEEYEAIGIERDLAGLPKFELPPEFFGPNATPDQIAMVAFFEDVVQQVRRDERWGIVMPAEFDVAGATGYKFSLESTGGRRQVDTDKVVMRHNRMMALSMAMQFIFLGTTSTGSFSLASSQTNLFSVALQGFIKSVKATLNRKAVHDLFKLSDEFPRETWPTFEHGDIESPDLKDLMQFILQGTQVGHIQPSEALTRRLHEIANLPEPDFELEE